MNEPEVGANALPPSDGSETSSNSPTSSEAQQMEMMALAQVYSFDTPDGSKKYTPPKADARTFPTQQAFLESLRPISIDDVSEDKRKCPICWKPFGEEADPGFDNSESPVKLRCNHVFGHKCLATIFAIQEHHRVSLQPISFEDCTRGLLLGARLHVYAAKHGPNFRDDIETFQSMVLEAEQRDSEPSGEELFGEYWWCVLQEVFKQRDNPSLTNITFMENAVILDYQLPKPEDDLNPYAIKSQFLNSSSMGLEQTLVQSALIPTASSMWASHHFGPTAMPSSFESVSKDSPSNMQPFFDKTASAQFLAVTGSTQSSIDPPGNDISGTWEVNLASETKLDKLSALQKQKANQAKTAVSSLDKTSEYVQKYQTHLLLQRTKAHEYYRKVLAERLAEAYSQFRKAQPRETKDTPRARPRIVRSSKTLHSYDLQNPSYEICAPSQNPMFGDEAEIDDDHEDVFDSAGATFVIERTMCSACSVSLKDHQLPAVLATPTEVWWHNHASAPDDCPICHKVLFLKEKMR